MDVNVSVTFKGGAGSLTITVESNGNEICNVIVQNSSTTTLKNVSQGDIISIDGISPANGTDISINVPTDPPTPAHYDCGPLMVSYLVL